MCCVMQRKKKMRKKEMENDNVVMCQLEEEGSNGKQQCGDVSILYRKDKGKTQKKLVLFHLHTIQTKWVTIMPEDTQVALQYLK